MKKIFIIVLNYNGGEEILAYLKSLYLIKTPRGWIPEILVVDNGSTDSSVDSVKELFINELKKKKQLVNSLTRNKIIINKVNLGFAGGMNVGIKHAQKNGAEAVLLLNQDTEVEKDCLFWLLRNPADVVAPVIKFRRDGKWVFDFGGKVNWWMGRTKHWEVSSIKYKVLSIDYVSGCAMLIRKPVLEKIGFLDERYFLYFEDVDFCLRAKKAGFKIAVEPRSIILHHLSPTEKKPFWQNFQLLKSNLIFINQWVPIFCRPMAYLYWLCLSIKILLII